MSKYIIETNDLTKMYGDQASINNLNIHVKQGEIYGLLGRNGAGKTTTMKILIGLIKASSGTAKIFGLDIQKDSEKILKRVGALIESPGFYPNLTGTENLKLFSRLRGVSKNSAVQDAMQTVGLIFGDKKLFSQYSLGMKQRLAIALAIMHDPDLLILDEPTNGLDPIGIAEMRELLLELSHEKGKTIIISSHILSEISLLVDQVGIIDHGKLLEEESLEELEQKNDKYIHYKVSNVFEVARILEYEFHVIDFKIIDDMNLYIYDTDLPLNKVNKAILGSSSELYEVHLKEDTLEDYFKKVTGGTGIA
ncbi:ABC transporter ATP-binding protein [Enterococcus sp. DIV0876]|uniref:ABC transporter ATP-binding protein n=1 Tax=Enterococcus sp. DIV0876 TaxID=2774633 RepID=UPI003D2FE700